MAAFKKGEGGRPKGSKNKTTIAKEKLLAEAIKTINADLGPDAFKGDGVEFLQAVYKNQDFDFQTRMEAATRAAPFERPKKTESTIEDKRENVVRMPAPMNLEDWKRMFMDGPPSDPERDSEFQEKIKNLSAVAAVKKEGMQ